VLVKSRGKGMTAGPVGDEIEVAGLGRPKHGVNRSTARIGDRSWR
jgi:hypothetical protein